LPLGFIGFVQRLRAAAAWRSRSPLAGLLPALVVLLGGCGIGAPTLTVPVSQWPGYEYFSLAEKRGLERKQGIRLALPAYANPQDIVHAYLRGDLKLAQLTTVEAVDLCSRVPKRCPVVILVLDESRGGDQVLVDRQLGSIAELRGQPVAITPSTLGPFVLSRALSRHGLGLGDVDLRPMPLEQMAGAIKRGEVRAAALFPPFSDQAVATGRVRPLFTSREIPGEIFDILVVDPAFLKEHRAALMALLRTWQDAHALAQAEPGPSNAVMAAREG
jgi:NitT/TauT family transport system substrate-binding protein